MEIATGCQHINDLPSGALHQIFFFLGPRDLCQVGATCRDWRALTIDAATNQTWAAFYQGRWRLPQAAVLGGMRWQEVYGTKMRLAQAWHGRFKQDLLYGHRGGVRSTALLPSCQLLATGSMDRYIRLWDLQSGVPLTSRKLSGTVRAVAQDPMQLAAAASPQGVIRMWSADPARAGAALFDIEGSPGSHLVGHTGPVTCLELDDSFLASGSWDYTARIWSRSSLRCRAVITFPDWLWDLRAAGGNLLVAAGACAHVVDLTTGERLRMFSAAGAGAGGEAGTGMGTRIEGSRDGRLVFHGTADGSINCYDLRAPSSAGAAQLWHHSSPVTGLAYEDPCLAACFQDGSVLMLQAEALAAQQGLGPAVPGIKRQRAGTSAGRSGRGAALGSDVRETGLRRQLGALGCPAYSIAIADQWLACSGESPVVRTWDFTEALVKQEQAQRAKQARANHKQQKRLRAQAAALAALTPSNDSPPADEEHIDEAGQLASASGSQHEDCSDSITNPAEGLRTAGTALAGAVHEHEQQHDVLGRAASASKGSAESQLASDQHSAASHHAANALPAVEPSLSSQHGRMSTHAQEDQPGNAWAVDGSGAHQGRSHFQAWHGGSHSGAIGTDHDDRHSASSLLSSSPQLPWGGDPHDPSAGNGCFEDELDEAGSEWCGDELPFGCGWIGGSRRGYGARLSHAASLGPHEGCNAEEGCDGHCCSLDEPSSGYSWGTTADLRFRSRSHQDMSGSRSRQPVADRSNSLSHRAAPEEPIHDPSVSRSRRRGAYGTSPVPMPIRSNGSAAPNAASGSRGQGLGPRSASATAARPPHEPCRLEAAGMQSWQIVRPRPVTCRDRR